MDFPFDIVFIAGCMEYNLTSNSIQSQHNLMCTGDFIAFGTYITQSPPKQHHNPTQNISKMELLGVSVRKIINII